MAVPLKFPSEHASAVQPSRAVAILGSTGSIGRNTLAVLRKHPRLRAVALSAASNAELLAEQCREFRPRYAVMANPEHLGELRRRLKSAGTPTEALAGPEALPRIASLPEIDTVMAAIVGAAGLESTLAAIGAGKKVLLANKESLVMAGDLCLRAARESGAVLIPVDSEHNAIFQCLPWSGAALDPAQTRHVEKLVLTCSGGPFLHTPAAEFAAITPAQACRHPKWNMGAKISVDSATLMNKGLEVIEACFLFGMGPDRVEVLIHPQSIVHSLVHYEDGSVLAQLGAPDMRIPIAGALAWPERMISGADTLNLAAEEPLEFLPPDRERFPCLGLGMEAARRRGSAPAVVNAANEVAVAAFLAENLPFARIAKLIEAVSAKIPCGEADSLDIILEIDGLARTYAKELIYKGF